MFVHNHLNRPCYVGMAVVLQSGWGPLCSDTEFEHAFFFGVLKNLNHTFESWLRGSLCSELWILYKFQQWNQRSCMYHGFSFLLFKPKQLIEKKEELEMQYSYSATDSGSRGLTAFCNSSSKGSRVFFWLLRQLCLCAYVLPPPPQALMCTHN